ncbi:MAG TPA: hypothetical protein EYQ60_01500 [Myxococcales bacterium]|nr:hypothetical protein [Myxococcales bacterium]HIK85224.1 hypothetical protein [Myxococcales bacterium]
MSKMLKKHSSSRIRWRRHGLIGFVLVAIAYGSFACERAVPVDSVRERLAGLDRPNLVLIVVDTLRADWMTPYGFSGEYEEETSPELARWGARGVVFERARAQSSWTKMSMASMMTSLWPRSHGIREPNDGLADGAYTLAEVLSEAGYHTYGVQTNGWLDQSFGFQQGFDRYVFPAGKGAESLPKPTIWPHADRVYKEAVRLIDGNPTDEPFFLYLHFMDVHEYAAPLEFKAFGSDAKGAYLAGIRWVDDAIERIREKLDDAGVLDQTVIVFASDHGETFGENGKHGHARNVLTPVLRVPLVIRFPFKMEPIRVNAQVRNADIAPTLVELAGEPIPESFEGRSLLPLLWGADDGNRDSFAALGFPLFRDASIQVSVSDGSWSYARNVEPDPNPAEFLFDRAVDPEENVNLIDLEPAMAATMRSLMDEHLSHAPVSAVRGTDVRIDPAIADRLRAMGYLQ